MTANVRLPLGFYKPSGSQFTRKDGKAFILATRPAPKKGQTHTYLLSLSPNGSRSYWSGLYPVEGSHGLYRAEYGGIPYLVLFESEGMSIALQGEETGHPDKNPLNNNRVFVSASETRRQ